ncbi:helix-turn-helix domain-containing protein [Brevibacillus humidisoli]|uniref:helix-turn-helix domain-containing protein n=1 Tax=Brevibacillus humidisoli TaxID=2895522 RepID=UPI001E368918|nr:helix-turn-helix domain-containing protein [Brevibacillus humidisoli]UFJ42822.1 helix-turn-helix domain-containing protein [Brevibacillus humidisoli]
MKQLSEREFDVLATVVLGGLLPLMGERTPQSLYYILVGRKANQTIQDVHHYRLHPYYRLIPSFLKENWQDFVTYFLRMGWMSLKKTGSRSRQFTFEITSDGREQWLSGRQRYQLERWLKPLNGIAYAERVDTFWMRLHLLIQTISHLRYRQPSFYPVVQRRQIQAWVKRQLHHPQTREHLSSSQLYHELLAVLASYDVTLQRLFADQLSGVTQVGYTQEQIAYHMDEPLLLVQIKMKYLLTRIYREVLENEEGRYPLLSRLATIESGRDPRLSASAAETFRLLQKGVNMEGIVRRRGLKQGTVEDHLVEIALHCPEWDVTPYLSQEQKQLILMTSRQAGTKRLRVIKELLGESCSYLQIRLALAQEGGE